MSEPPSTRQTKRNESPRAAAGLRGAMAARLLPQTRFAGPIPWVIAILIALVVVAAAGGLALRNLAETARGDLSNAVTVQIVEADPERRTLETERVAEALAGQDLVRSVRVVPKDELDELLEPWLGESAGSEDLPIPALIDVELSRVAAADEIRALQDYLQESVPGARVDAQSEWLRPVYDALSALQFLALALIALVAFATAAAVWLAARSAFANHSDTVEIIHLLGGTDSQLTGIFQRSVFRDAAFGAVVGLLLGLAAVWLLGQQFEQLDSGMIAGGGLGWTDWFIIGAIPVAGVLLALVTGRITIAVALRKML
ncbi:MAG: cell division protein [Erythrobacter sp.]|nr:cell division protein [Erythrobacter sp.]